MAGSRSVPGELASAPEPRLAGRLERGGEALAVAVTAASRISLWAAFGDAPEPADGAVFDALVLPLDGREVRLSRCRFHAERTPRGSAGRLVFLDDVYDCRSLVYEGKFVDLRAFFHNLPLVMAQKERIRPEFKEFVSGALFDLSVYKRFFDEQDRILAGEPAGVAEAARAALVATEGRKFMAFFDAHLAELEKVVAGYAKEEHERHGFYLRRQAWPYILGSEFLKRTNLKPRGYAGDAEMMEMIYANAYVGTYVFNQLMHKHPVETAAAQAVRNRRRLVPRVLREVLARFPGLPEHGFRFLSVASGPAWEMQDLFLDADDFERFHCALLDQDPHALDLARQAVGRIESTRGIEISVEYVHDSVRTMLRVRDMPARFGRYHFIYSMGLFDYLTPPVARAVLAKTYELLLPGGSLVVGNYHVRNPTRIYMDYWMDWALYYRTEESFLALAEGLPGATPSVTFDETGCQMFLRLDKGA